MLIGRPGLCLTPVFTAGSRPKSKSGPFSLLAAPLLSCWAPAHTRFLGNCAVNTRPCLLALQRVSAANHSPSTAILDSFQVCSFYLSAVAAPSSGPCKRQYGGYMRASLCVFLTVRNPKDKLICKLYSTTRGSNYRTRRARKRSYGTTGIMHLSILSYTQPS